MRHSRIIAEQRALKVFELIYETGPLSPEEQKARALSTLGEPKLEAAIDQVELGMKEYANYLEEVEAGEHDNHDQ